MNERNEIGGDLRDEYLEIQEAEEANRLAPEPEPLTDEELEAWHLDWCERNGEAPDLIPDGEGVDPSGETVPRWRLV